MGEQSQHQKLFSLPGTIEEENNREDEALSFERQNRGSQGPESPLLSPHHHKTSINILPKNTTLIRVSTQSSVGRPDSARSRYRAGPVRRIRRRAVLKNGECNVLKSKISQRSIRYLQDIFTTLVDTQWRWTLSCFALSFFLSWLIFATVWWLIAFTHGDFDPRHQSDESWKPCVTELYSFTSCFLFSIETQHTIGYGGRSTTEECPEAIFVMFIQSVSGVMIQAFMVGIVFAKMSRPKQRTQTLLFSKNAVVCQRDGELCLMFRVGDMRKSHIIGATVRAQVIRTRTTKEGEVLPHNQQELIVGTDGQTENLFFIWPITVVHKINDQSPFYHMSAEDMLTERYEVVVILEGTIESTGQSTQARSSYLPQEILWGHRFEPMVSYSKERQGYEVDYSLFNLTTQIDTPLCSSKELTEFYKIQEEIKSGNSGYLVEEDIISNGGGQFYNISNSNTSNNCNLNDNHLNRAIQPYQRRQKCIAQPMLTKTESYKSIVSYDDSLTNGKYPLKDSATRALTHRLSHKARNKPFEIIEIESNDSQFSSNNNISQVNNNGKGLSETNVKEQTNKAEQKLLQNFRKLESPSLQRPTHFRYPLLRGDYQSLNGSKNNLIRPRTSSCTVDFCDELRASNRSYKISNSKNYFCLTQKKPDQKDFCASDSGVDFSGVKSQLNKAHLSPRILDNPEVSISLENKDIKIIDSPESGFLEPIVTTPDGGIESMASSPLDSRFYSRNQDILVETSQNEFENHRISKEFFSQNSKNISFESVVNGNATKSSKNPLESVSKFVPKKKSNNENQELLLRQNSY